MAGEGAVAGDGLPGEVARKARPAAPIARVWCAHSSSSSSSSVPRAFSFSVLQVLMSRCNKACLYFVAGFVVSLHQSRLRFLPAEIIAGCVVLYFGSVPHNCSTSLTMSSCTACG